MQTKFNSIRFAICALLLFCGAFATATFSQTLKQITKFDLPGPGGKRFDYLTIDCDDRGHARCRRSGVRPGAQEVLHLECQRQHHRSRGPEADEGRQKTEDRSEARWKHLCKPLSQAVRFRRARKG